MSNNFSKGGGERSVPTPVIALLDLVKNGLAESDIITAAAAAVPADDEQLIAHWECRRESETPPQWKGVGLNAAAAAAAAGNVGV